eukprot:TRINITY_DN6223_c0_g1_i3.p1 TRINITY_DN6223_c0_g1~~TRINITY_DN6223_c0_g1_i3.p1  ORF type:complete len:301 (-),score=73.68 TRINITY_DN6223_c0_g1_i3:21-923(-)
MAAGPGFKVCVCGGAGGIGQPLSLLMAMNRHVSELNVYDLDLAAVPAAGVAADLGHIERRCKVKAFAIGKDDRPVDKLSECLQGCHLVLIPAGLPRKPGMTRADLLGVNIGIAKGIVEACARYCPNAVLGLIVNPVNSVVPAMCELYRRHGLDTKKICGVTTLDVVRANKFVHEVTGETIDRIDVPVVGGHAGETILPLFSQDAAGRRIPAEKIADLDKRVQDAGTEVVNAKVVRVARRSQWPTLAHGSEPLSLLGWQVHPIGDLSAHEAQRMTKVSAQLKEEIDAGIEAFNKMQPAAKL